LAAAGFSLIGKSKGLAAGGLILSAINLFAYYTAGDWHALWFWQTVIVVYTVGGLLGNYFLNKKTAELRFLKVTAGSAVSVLSLGVFFPLIPAALIWGILAGLPLIFTYREVPKAFYLQIIFKFIFSCGWIIIGNIAY